MKKAMMMTKGFDNEKGHDDEKAMLLKNGFDDENEAVRMMIIIVIVTKTMRFAIGTQNDGMDNVMMVKLRR